MLNALSKVLAGQASDEVVWTADISYWIDAQVRWGNVDPVLRTEQGCLEFCRKLGCMPYYWYETFWAFDESFEGTEIVKEVVGNVTTQRFRSAAGELYETNQFAPESCSVAHTKYLVENEADLRTMLKILEGRRLRPAVADYPARQEAWRAFDGVPAIALPRSPLSNLLVQWAGVQNGTYLLLDCPDLVVEALKLFAAQEELIIDALCELKPPLVHFPDNLSSEIYTGFFDAYMADVYRHRLERLHAAGVRSAVHLDGTVRGLLPKLSAVGMDAIEALTPSPVGDATVEEMSALAGRADVVLWGGMPGAMFSAPFTWEDVRSHLDRLLRCWSGRPFILGVGDQVPPDGDIDMCRRISDFVRQWRP